MPILNVICYIDKILSRDRLLANKLVIQKSIGYIIGDFLLKQPITEEYVERVVQAMRKSKK